MKPINAKTDETGKVIEFDIDREFWDRGRDAVGELRNDEGMMCCLGFYSLACGLDEQDIVGFNYTWHLDLDVPEQLLWLARTEREKYTNDMREAVGHDLGAINDDGELSEKERECKIQAKFAKRGIKVNFV